MAMRQWRPEMTDLALPTRKDEDFRYADLPALAQVWPSGQRTALSLVETAATPIARELAIVVEAGAAFDLRILNAGSAYGRIAVRAELHAGARFTLGAVQLGGGEQRLELVTEVRHLGPDAQSRQIVRSVLGGSATGTYLGKVAVARDCNGTDSEQSVRAMLLSRMATANAKPELEIYSDDVKCAHGCAIGELDATALFYLAARGLPPEKAKQLMLQAFVAEAFAGSVDEERLLGLALERLGDLV
jgi:Fe-S cluster assembly protein SufD